MPSWQWKGDIKTSFTSVTIEGIMPNTEAASVLKRALVDHTEMMKPSVPGAQSISINAGTCCTYFFKCYAGD